MKPLRGASLVLLLALLGGCASGSDSPAGGRDITSPAVDEMLNPTVSGGIELESDGLTTVEPTGSRLEIPFGTPLTELVPELHGIIGAPESRAPVADCNAGGTPEQLVWPGLLLLSNEGVFVGWEATDDEYSVIGKKGTLTIGAPLARVEADLGPLDLERTSRGYEFVVREGDIATYAGAFETTEPSAPLVAITAGVNCYVR